jgi:hypothetical protein
MKHNITSNTKTQGRQTDCVENTTEAFDWYTERGGKQAARKTSEVKQKAKIKLNKTKAQRLAHLARWTSSWRVTTTSLP